MMKNLFKNLMLVAVAAMAFTACTETNEEVNAVAKKTVITGVATIDNDDTRSGFVGSETTENEDGTTTTTYQSAWDGGETIKLYINYGAAETTATIDAEGKFTAVFEGDFAESCTISACSPAEAWSSESSFTIPAEQTPRTDSVDPAAHILKAQTITVTNGSASFNMQHEVAYGKMTVNTPAGFVIDHVDIELNGAWFGYDKSLSYTINADNVKNNTFWFATDVIEVSEMTVTAYDADDKAYTKTVTMNENKTLKFQYYKVSTFSVSNLTEQKESISLSTMSTGASHNYGFGYTFTNDNDTNFTIVFSDWIATNSSINPGTYNVVNSVSYVNKVNVALDASKTYKFEGVSKKLSSGTISVAKDGETYTIEMSLVLSNGTALDYKYVGSLGGNSSEGGSTPTEPTKLATPSVSCLVSGNTATVSWQDVAGAKDYSVSLNGTYYSTVETAYIVLTDLEYSTTYNVSVVANPADATVNSASDAGTASFTTEADPNGGEGGETSTWSFTPSLEGGMMSRYCTFIFTGDDGDTISSYFVYPNKAQVVGTYTVSTLNNLDGTNYRMSEIRLNGIYATSGSGSVTISFTNDGGYLFELDLVLNGKTYKGSAVL